jgi:phosphoribosylanthranilate isomerase
LKVKVCGITTYGDAAAALDCGADALGFIFYPPSPRYLDPGAARAIVRRLPPFTVCVGLFVNVETPEQVDRTARAAGVQVLQLQGDEPPEFCARLERWTVIKALRVGVAGLLDRMQSYPVQSFLLDTPHAKLYGGTGETFDWNLVRGVKWPKPVILAGGLKAENVGAAMEALDPYAVDVCSGVESAPGKKDVAKLKEFLDEVRRFTARRAARLRA